MSSLKRTKQLQRGKELKARPRAKGSRAEAHIVNLFKDRGWHDTRRNFASGGFGGGDLTGGPTGTCWEIKHVERLNLYAAFDQCCAAAKPTDTAIVAHKRNFKPWLATLELNDLLELYAMRDELLAFKAAA